ncbi:MAG: hypothetical protein Q9187_000727, partial [Circinaria calcarea]
MRLSQSPSTLLSLLAVILSSTHIAYSKPYPRDASVLGRQNSILEIRACSNPCGWSGQLCCAADQACYTDVGGQAQCGAISSGAAVTGAAAPVNGQWQYFTTTYVRTDLVTIVTTFSTFIPSVTVTTSPAVQTLVATTTVVTPAAFSTPVCNPALNEQSCGSICCASGQFCQTLGQCAAYGGSSVNGVSTVFIPTSVSSASASAFIRPTSNTVQTVTSTGSATTTIPFQTPIATNGSAIVGMMAANNNGLSGGAIAGIVIGVLAGIFLLFLLCACLCFKSALDGLLGIFGGGKKKRRTETITIEERHSHHSGGVATGGGRRWFGNRPARVDRPPKKTSGVGGAVGVAGILTALAVVLGLRRKGRRVEEKSDYGTGSSYTYSDYTSA